MIIFRLVMASRHLENVEPKFRLDVRCWVLLVGYYVTILTAQFWIVDWNGAICADRMAVIIGGVVRESSQGKCILVGVLRFRYQGFNKISCPYVVEQIAEVLFRKRIIAHILDNAASIGISVRVAELLLGETGKAFQKHPFKVVFPDQIDDC